MKKNTLIIHSVWALTAAGTWWLGAHQGDSDAITAREARGRLAVAISSSRTGAPSPDSAEQRVVEKQAGTLPWLRSWSGTDGRISPGRMAEAVRAAQSEGPLLGLTHFLELLECLTPENAPAAMEVLKASSGSHMASWMNLLCTAWGSQSGAAALAALTGREQRGAAIAGWAQRDPAAAQKWLAALKDDESDDDWRDLQVNLVRGLSRQDMAAAVSYITAQKDGERGELARVVAGEQLARGAPAAAQWAAELPDPAMRGPALEAVARHYMEVDPGAGATWGSEISTAPDTREAVARVADRMAEKDVRAAFAWTLQLPASPGQEEAFQQVFSEWARQDPGASSEELRSMTPGRERDNAIHSFSRILVNESPGDAIIWATAITDPALRLDTQIDVARTWNAASPAEAQTWITAHLPAEAQARALAKD